MAASASRLSLVTVVPLPEASPSALTTHGGPILSRALFATAASVKVSQRGVGTLYREQRSFAKLFEVSIRAALLSGPKIGSFCFRNVSTMPAPSGDSGPTTVRSMCSLATNEASSSTLVLLIGTHVPISSMHGLPGAG